MIRFCPPVTGGHQDVTSTHGHIGSGHRNKDAVFSVEGMERPRGWGELTALAFAYRVIADNFLEAQVRR